MIRLKGGTVVSGTGCKKADVVIDGERILWVGDDGDDLERILKKRCGGGEAPDGKEAAEIADVDVGGKLLFPGFIDTHTHFDLEAPAFHTADDFYSGTKAAVAGGTTCILDHATPEPGESLGQALARWHRKADQVSSCDYGFHMAVTRWSDTTEAEIRDMVRQGVTSFKLYMAYDNLRVDDASLYRIVKVIGREGGIAGAHCENGDLINERMRENKEAGRLSLPNHPLTRPPEVEAEAVGRFLAIGGLAECPVYVVHLSTGLGLTIGREAKRRGQDIYLETCPQYLFFDDSVYEYPDFEGAKYMMSPPMRKKEDQEALWKGLAEDVIDFTGTDHCSFHFHGMKDYFGRDDYTKIPNGGPGVEDRARLLYTYGVQNGRISNGQFCRAVSEKAAKVFGMFPKKGIIAPGSDADIVVLDPDYQGVIRQADQVTRLDYNLYEGMRVGCRIESVYLRGRLAAKDGKVVKEGLGEYIKRRAYQALI